MNAAHFHIVINHFPVVLMLASATIAIHGWIRKSAEVKRVALIMAVIAASFTLATYFSGEPAADFIENAAIVNDMHIEDHEEAAEKSVIITTLTGLAAAAAFFLGFPKIIFCRSRLPDRDWTLRPVGQLPRLDWLQRRDHPPPGGLRTIVEQLRNFPPLNIWRGRRWRH